MADIIFNVYFIVYKSTSLPELILNNHHIQSTIGIDCFFKSAIYRLFIYTCYIPLVKNLLNFVTFMDVNQWIRQE